MLSHAMVFRRRMSVSKIKWKKKIPRGKNLPTHTHTPAHWRLPQRTVGRRNRPYVEKVSKEAEKRVVARWVWLRRKRTARVNFMQNPRKDDRVRCPSRVNKINDRVGSLVTADDRSRDGYTPMCNTTQTHTYTHAYRTCDWEFSVRKSVPGILLPRSMVCMLWLGEPVCPSENKK